MLLSFLGLTAAQLLTASEVLTALVPVCTVIQTYIDNK